MKYTADKSLQKISIMVLLLSLKIIKGWKDGGFLKLVKPARDVCPVMGMLDVSVGDVDAMVEVCQNCIFDDDCILESKHNNTVIKPSMRNSDVYVQCIDCGITATLGFTQGHLSTDKKKFLENNNEIYHLCNPDEPHLCKILT